MAAVLFLSLSILLLISIVNSRDASELVWPQKGHNQPMTHRLNPGAITMGRYSEREGDRDLLDIARISSAVADQSEKLASSKMIGGHWTVGQAAVERQRQPNIDGPNSFTQQQTLSRPVRPIISTQSLPAAVGPARGLSRYDTILSRSAAAPSTANRIVLPPNFVEQIRNGVSTMNAFVRHKSQQTDSSQRQMMQKEANANGDNEIERPKTVILTNDRIAKAPPAKALTDDGTMTESGGNKSKYQKSVPLSEFRHEDIRPAIDGERLGTQSKYAGQTNEYREDLGKQFTRVDWRRAGGAEYFGPMKFNGGNGPASRLAGMGISPPDEREQWHGNGGRISPYVNAPEEITGSRFRNVDERLNALNGGNEGRGPNRYVKMDLLNE